MKHVVMYSGGLASDETAEIVVRQHGLADTTFLFCDTLVEDDDLYRFLIESTARRVGVDPAPLLPLVADLPPVWQVAARRDRLQRAREAVCAAMPSLVWLMDGRNVWQVAFDQQYIGNSRVCHGAIYLKVIQRNLWLEANVDPAGATCYVGIYHWERDRFFGRWERKSGSAPTVYVEENRDLFGEDPEPVQPEPVEMEWVPGIRELGLPWRYESPLSDLPLIRATEVKERLRQQGIAIPRLYLQGAKTNNCGRACRKAGIGSWTELYHHDRARFMYEAHQERDFQQWKETDATILRVTEKGVTRPLSLLELAARIEAKREWTPEELIGHDIGCGGSCAFDQEAA